MPIPVYNTNDNTYLADSNRYLRNNLQLYKKVIKYLKKCKNDGRE
jgi:hypothetical protein